jgi:hypothetical protein
MQASDSAHRQLLQLAGQELGIFRRGNQRNAGLVTIHNGGCLHLRVLRWDGLSSR